MYTIAVIDDDEHINKMLAELLSKEGYWVVQAYSGTEALYLLSKNRPDLVLLDLMMPGLSGEEVLLKVKGIPVIVISAKTDIQNKVSVLLDGAADYVTKPFDPRELLARITVQLRNSTGTAGFLLFDELTLYLDGRRLFVGEEEIRLTKTEYAILKLLMVHPSQVITKSAILDKISQDTPDCVETSLKVHISNLRRKLRDVSGKDYIEAVWGIGFKMRDQKP